MARAGKAQHVYIHRTGRGRETMCEEVGGWWRKRVGEEEVGLEGKDTPWQAVRSGTGWHCNVFLPRGEAGGQEGGVLHPQPVGWEGQRRSQGRGAPVGRGGREEGQQVSGGGPQGEGWQLSQG